MRAGVSESHCNGAVVAYDVAVALSRRPALGQTGVGASKGGGSLFFLLVISLVLLVVAGAFSLCAMVPIEGIEPRCASMPAQQASGSTAMHQTAQHMGNPLRKIIGHRIGIPNRGTKPKPGNKSGNKIAFLLCCHWGIGFLPPLSKSNTMRHGLHLAGGRLQKFCNRKR